MADFDLDIIVPAHCTGFRAVTALVNAFGNKIVPSAVGRLYQF
jgi:7,8-dihydropterin-6-yl-methyl-4-(beta-D-ribofuranosyl)aminobenzene 5'-phosphate synthase